MDMRSFELIMSPLCQIIERDGKQVDVQIYKGDDATWTLEVEDHYGNSTVWDEEFKTDQLALDECLKTITEEGIDSLIGEPSTRLH